MPNPSPNNSSAFGPQGVGANSLPFEAMWATQNRNNTMQLMQWAALTDPRAKAAATMAARAFTQERPGYQNMAPDQFLRNTQEGRAMMAGAAGLASSGVFGGGSVGQLAFGAQQMAGNSGFRMNIDGRPAGQQFFGAGQMTNIVAQQMVSKMRDRYINPSTGLPEASARGMDQTDMGQAMQALSNKGMFQGMNAGRLHQINPGDTKKRDAVVNELKSQNLFEEADRVSKMDMSKGGNEFTLDPGTFKKVSSIMDSTAAMMADFRDIFGKQMPVGEIINQAEKLTGMSFGTAGTAEAARAKLANIKTKGQTLGRNVGQMIEDDLGMQMGLAGSMANTFGGKPSDYAGVAAGMTTAITNSSITMKQQRNEALAYSREPGARFVMDATEDDIKAMQGQGMVSLMQENGIAAAALYASEASPALAEKKEEIQSLVAQLGKTQNTGEQQSIEARLQAIAGNISLQGIVDAHGGDVGQLLGKTGQSNQNLFNTMTGNMDQSRMINNIQSIDDQFHYSEKGVTAGLMDDLTSSLDETGMHELTGLLKSGAGKDELGAFFEKNKAYLGDNTAEGMTNIMMDGVRAYGADFGTNISAYHGTIKDSKMLINKKNRKSQMEASSKSTDRFFTNRMFGNSAINSEGALDSMWRGITGDGEVTDSSVLEHMRSTNPTGLSEYKMKADGSGMDISEEEAAKLSKQLGVKISAGMDGEALQAAFASSNAVWGYSEKDGNKSITVADQASADASKSVLTDFNRAMTAMTVDGTVHDAESEAKARAELGALSSEELKAKINALPAVGAAFDTTAIMTKGGGGEAVMQSLISNATEAEDAKKGSPKVANVDELKKGTKAKGEGGHEFYGTLTMKIGDEYQVDLFT